VELCGQEAQAPLAVACHRSRDWKGLGVCVWPPPRRGVPAAHSPTRTLWHHALFYRSLGSIRLAIWPLKFMCLGNAIRSKLSASISHCAPASSGSHARRSASPNLPSCMTSSSVYLLIAMNSVSRYDLMKSRSITPPSACKSKRTASGCWSPHASHLHSCLTNSGRSSLTSC